MSFVNINEYGEYKLPIAGNVTKYIVCEGIDSYKPYDVGDISSSIDYVCENIKEVNYCDGLNKNLSDLNEQWGEKFIAIDGKNIGCDFCKYKDLCFMSNRDIIELEDIKDLDFLEQIE